MTCREPVSKISKKVMETHASSKKPPTIFELIQPTLVAITGLNLLGLGLETFSQDPVMTSSSFVVPVVPESCLQRLSIARPAEPTAQPKLGVNALVKYCPDRGAQS